MNDSLSQQRADLAARMRDPLTKAGILNNGLTWYMRRNTRPENKALVALIVKTGSVYEDAGNYGIAHFIEHMLFNGTKNYDGEALIEELQRLGVGFGHDLNAYTTLDHTVYHLEIEGSAENIRKALHILADFAFTARLEQKHIEKERPIILEEKRLRSGRGEKYIRLLLEKVFGGTPYERLVIGTEEDITGVQKEDFDAFYARWYRPDNMAVAVCGDVDLDVLQQEIEELFSAPCPDTPLAEAPLALPSYRPAASDSIFSHEETASGGLHYFTTLPLLHAKIASEDHQDWMRYVIAESLNERLGTFVMENTTPVSQTQADYSGEYTRRHDLFSVGGIFKTEGLKEAASLLETEIERMRRFGPTTEEIRRICATLRQRLELRIVEKDTTQHWAYGQKMMSSFLLDDEVGTPEEDLRLLDEYEKTPLETIRSIAVEMLAPAHLVCILEMPQATDTMMEEVRSIRNHVAAMEIHAPEDTSAETAERIFSGTMDVLQQTEIGEPLSMTKLQLPCGAPAYIKHTTFQKDRFLCRILFEAGDVYLPRDQQGLTDAMLKYMMYSGTSRRSLSVMSKLLQEKNISLALEEEGASSVALFGSCKTEHAPLLLELAHDMLFDPLWKESGWQRAKQYMRLELEEALANPHALLGERHDIAVMREHPHSFMPTLANLDSWTADMAEEYYRRTFTGANMHVTIVSSLSVDTSTELLAQYFGTVPVREKPSYETLKTTLPFPGNALRQVIYGTSEEKASVRYSLPGVPYLHPQRSLYVLAAEVLSDRLRKAVREDMGNTYSIGAGHIGYKCLRGGEFTIRFGTGPKNVDAVITRIEEEIARLAEGGVTQDEITRSLAPFRTQFEAETKENSFWLHAILDPWNNIPETVIFDNYERLQSIHAEELSHFLKKDFRTQPAIVTILLPRA